jgi:hypothetical protein
MYTHNGVTYWACGTTIATVAKFYQKQRKAFPSLPSYEHISLGAWFATHSHGSSGNKGKGSNACFGLIDYVDTRGRVRQDSRPTNVHCVLGIQFVDLPPNREFQKGALFITPRLQPHHVDAWLEDAFQRVLFIGSRYIGIVWRDVTDKTLHKDPHCCSRCCLWLQIDPLNLIGPCQEPKRNYSALVHNYDINRLVPRLYPVMVLFSCLQYNYELVLKPQPRDVLYAICLRLHDIPGRFEIRYGGNMYIDVSVRRTHLHAPYAILDEMNIPYTFHQGKYIPS